MGLRPPRLMFAHQEFRAHRLSGSKFLFYRASLSGNRFRVFRTRANLSGGGFHGFGELLEREGLGQEHEILIRAEIFGDRD